MNNQEAINIIRTAVAQVEWDYPMDYAAAFDKAIEALEQPEIVRCMNCKYCVKEPNGELYCDILADEYEHLGIKKVTADWFCADGEHE